MTVDSQTRKLAAIAYGEASTADVPDEIAAIAWAVANRARAWGGKTIDELLAADKNYTFVVSDGNSRYQRLLNASEEDIAKNAGMSAALSAARNALTKTGIDPSNGAFWWDGKDFKTNYDNHRKVKDGFHFTNPSHNIFHVEERSHLVTLYWKVRDRKTQKEVDSKVRGRYEYVWESRAAHGSTIFWSHDPDYIETTGGKAYR